MVLFRHELRQNRLSLILWSAILSFMLGVCVAIYPEMASQMGDISDMFANMGNFSAAFGLDRLNFGEFMGYFSIECGNVLGLGGAFFAAIQGTSALAKEERDRTAEFLLSHPVSRTRILSEKLAAIFAEILILNLSVAAVTAGLCGIMGEGESIPDVLLLLLVYFLMQLEIAALSFGISAFLRRGSTTVGIGLAVMLYFLNLIANLTEDAAFLKYITPFACTDGAVILEQGFPEPKYLCAGLLLATAGIVIAYSRYRKKDIR